MQFFNPDSRVDFIGVRKYAFLLSGVAILVGILSLLVRGGPNYGIDFLGGTMVQVRFRTPQPIAGVRDALDKLRAGDLIVQEFGDPREVLIRVEKSDANVQGLSARIRKALAEGFGGKDEFEVRRVETVGPTVGADLRRKALLAVLYSMIGILIYISWRFEFRFAVAAIAALAHDVLITIGAFSVLNLEFTLPVVAAILTIIGYSLNDTIVVFDRIRENLRNRRKETIGELINASVNQTMSRTILTSVTTLIVILILYFFGGEVIRGFAFALLVGVVAGTYSSIYIASPIILIWTPATATATALRKKKKRA
ncbi:MAG: protein translocase subunit SecF [Nitrospinota bacterium]